MNIFFSAFGKTNDIFLRLVLDNEEEEDDPVIMYLNIKADLHQSFWTLKKSKFFLIPPNL